MTEESENGDMGFESKSFKELKDEIFDIFTKEKEDGSFELSYEGVKAGELLYKEATAHNLAEGEEDEPPGWIVETLTLGRLEQEIFDKYEDWHEKEDAHEWEMRFLISDEFVLFYTLANEVIQGLAGELINQELFDEERQSDSSLGVARELPQEVKEDLLFYSGLVDNGLKGEMVNIRKIRNKLIHDLRNRHYLDEIENVESRLSRAFDVINELHTLVEGKPAFNEEI